MVVLHAELHLSLDGVSFKEKTKRVIEERIAEFASSLSLCVDGTQEQELCDKIKKLGERRLRILSCCTTNSILVFVYCESYEAAVALCELMISDLPDIIRLLYKQVSGLDEHINVTVTLFHDMEYQDAVKQLQYQGKQSVL